VYREVYGQRSAIGFSGSTVRSQEQQQVDAQSKSTSEAGAKGKSAEGKITAVLESAQPIQMREKVESGIQDPTEDHLESLAPANGQIHS